MTKNINSLKNLSDITDFMHNLLSEVTTDLEKSSKGNKAASQRVRTGTVKLEKVAKMYRKESILSEKHPSHKAKAKAKKAAPAKHKAPASKATAQKGHSTPKHAPAKSHSAAKAKPAVKASASHASHSSHASHGKSQATHAATKAKPAAAAAAKHKAPVAKKPTAKLPARSR